MFSRARRLWLPAVAVLLPCAFIAVLAVQWLALEREASAQRGEQGVRRTVEGLARDLARRLTDVGAELVRGDAVNAAEPQFARSPLPDPVTSAFFVDMSGRPIESSASKRPSNEGPGDPVAASLIAQAAAALNAGNRGTTLTLAAQIFECCRTSRDEYGVAYVFYAAWQRADVYRSDRRRSPLEDALAGEMQRLASAGDLDTAADIVHMKLLSDRLASSPAAMHALATIEANHTAAARRADLMGAASAYLTSSDRPADDEVTVGALRPSGGELIAAARASDNRRLVMIVDRPALAAWIAQWTGAHPRFDVALASPRETSSAVGFQVPLLPDAPGLMVSARALSADAGTDRRRERLFIAAAGGALVLTLFVGYFALRDMSRELSLASLRAAFIAGVTHELKTPLTSIRLLAETLRQDRAKPETRAELLETVVHETERLSEVVDNVLSSSRIESGTRTYDLKPVSLPQAVRGVLQRFDYVLAKEGFQLEARIDDAPLPVRVDADALGQALLNLLGNAVKYSGASRVIQVAVSRGSDGTASVIVTDRGIGIPASEQERIFQSFYRVPGSAADVAGAGLGLSLVRHFAEAHGGRISVASRPDEGSAFTLSLPLAPAEDVATAAAPAHG